MSPSLHLPLIAVGVLILLTVGQHLSAIAAAGPIAGPIFA